LEKRKWGGSILGARFSNGKDGNEKKKGGGRKPAISRQKKRKKRGGSLALAPEKRGGPSKGIERPNVTF